MSGEQQQGGSIMNLQVPAAPRCKASVTLLVSDTRIEWKEESPPKVLNMEVQMNTHHRPP